MKTDLLSFGSLLVKFLHDKGRGGVLDFYSDIPSLNPAKVNSFNLLNFLRMIKIYEK